MFVILRSCSFVLSLNRNDLNKDLNNDKKKREIRYLCEYFHEDTMKTLDKKIILKKAKTYIIRKVRK